MKHLAIAVLLALAGVSWAQSVSLAFAPRRIPQTTLSYPLVQNRAFRSKDWNYSLDLSEVGGSGVSAELAIEHRFWSACLFKIPVLSAYWKVSVSPLVEQPGQKGYGAVFLGISVR